MTETDQNNWMMEGMDLLTAVATRAGLHQDGSMATASTSRRRDQTPDGGEHRRRRATRGLFSWDLPQPGPARAERWPHNYHPAHLLGRPRRSSPFSTTSGSETRAKS